MPSSLELNINNIVAAANGSPTFAGLIEGLQTQPVNTLFSSLGAQVLTTQFYLGSQNLPSLFPATSAIAGLGAFGQAILNDDILPDVAPSDPASDVLGSTLSNLQAKVIELQNLGVSTAAFPTLTQSAALAYVATLAYNTASTGTSNPDALINGQNGQLVLNGGAGDDLIGNLGRGDYQLNGGDGDDIMANISRFTSVLDGGEGNDWLLNIGTRGKRVKGGAGDDTLINIGSRRNRLMGGDGNDMLFNYGEDNNFLNGGKGDDLIVHFGNDAKIFGGAGKDTLVGGTGDDLLNGGGGDDVLVGNGGSDTFFLSMRANLILGGITTAFAGLDVIADFDDAVDELKLRVTGSGRSSVNNSDLSFDNASGVLSYDGSSLAVLEGVSNFDVNTVQIV